MDAAAEITGTNDQATRLTRTYKISPTVARQAGSFAHAVVLASLLPSDWQFGEDADHATRNLVTRSTLEAPTATSIRVDVALDLDGEYFEVEISTDNGWVATGRAQPRRPFTTKAD